MNFQALEPGIYENIPFADYLRIPAASSSVLKVLHDSDRTPAHAMAKGKETAALNTGRDLHLATLEPEELEKQIVIYGGGDRRGADWKAFAEANAGRIIYKPNEIETLLTMRDAIWKHRTASRILTGSRREVTCIWYEDVEIVQAEIVRVRCKARFDILRPGMVCDVKSTAKPAGDWSLPHTVKRYGYHIQAAHYLTGAQAIEGCDAKSFAFIFLEKDLPHLVRCVELDAESMMKGRQGRDAALRIYAQCFKKGEWPGYPDDRIETISLP